MTTTAKAPNPLNRRSARVIHSLLLEQGECVMTVRGKSMEPFLHARQQVLLRSTTGTDLTIGKCYAYYHGGRIFLHRLAGYKNQHPVFCGDNRLDFASLSEQAVIGVMVEPQNIRSPGALRLIDKMLLQFKKRPKWLMRLRRKVYNVYNVYCKYSAGRSHET